MGRSHSHCSLTVTRRSLAGGLGPASDHPSSFARIRAFPGFSLGPTVPKGFTRETVYSDPPFERLPTKLHFDGGRREMPARHQKVAPRFFVLIAVEDESMA